ncbi:hypothetical protein [Archangium sp.]|uniref:hypothetical protein n=1 Tax=Archangium sp. TaxID=1872627 RepID=UPI002D5EC4B4|nr:hypothetical protein [Archangium sp.]HYO56866.1 hypothetical protein [Archangium sp.]
MSWSAALVLCFATAASADAPVRTETPEPAVCAQGSLQSSLRTLEQQTQEAQPGEPASVPATSNAQASSPEAEPAWCEARLCMSDMDCPCRGYCNEDSVCQYF